MPDLIVQWGFGVGRPIAGARALCRAAMVLVALGLAACTHQPVLEMPQLPGHGSEGSAATGPAREVAQAKEPSLTIDAREVLVPPTLRFTLPQGLQVVAVADSDADTSAYFLVAGDETLPGVARGVDVAQVTARVLEAVVESQFPSKEEKPPDAIVSVSARGTTVIMHCREPVGSRLCPSALARGAIGSPIAESTVVNARAEVVREIRERRQVSSTLADDHLHESVWGVGEAASAVVSEERLAKLGRADVVAFRRALFAPDRTTLIVTGQFDAGLLKDVLARAFSQWKPRARVGKESPPQRGAGGMRVLLVDKPGEKLAHIRIGMFGEHRRSSAAPAPRAVALVAGEASAFRLETLANTRRSIVELNSAMGSFGDAHCLTVAATAEVKDAVVVTQSVLDQLATSRTEAWSEQEIHGAKVRAVKDYQTRFSADSTVVDAILESRARDAAIGEPAEFVGELVSVDGQDLQDFASHVLHAGNSRIVIVADANRVEPQLTATGWVFDRVDHRAPIGDEKKALPVAGLDPSEPADPGVPVDEVRALIGAALREKGGQEKLQEVQSLHWRGNATLSLPGGPASAVVEKRFIAPDKLRLDLEIANKTKVTTVLAGHKAWVVRGGAGGESISDSSPAEVAALRGQAWREQDLVLLRGLDPKAQVAALQDRNLDGKSLAAIRVVTGRRHEKVTLLIDRDTKSLVAMEYTEQGVVVLEKFSDYRIVDGVKIAHKRDITSKGESAQIEMSVVIDTVRLVGRIAPFHFLRPKPKMPEQKKPLGPRSRVPSG